MPEFSTDFPKTFDAIRSSKNAGHHTGAQIFISRSNQTLANTALGNASPGVDLTPDSLLMWFSAGKPITAVAIAKLWEAGKLDLDDPVIRFIPEFAARGKEAITLRHLLTHTAGFRLVESSPSWEEMIARICNAPIEPRWIPGKTAGYHAFTTWYLLGEIICRLDPDHRRFEQIIEGDIFTPLGMTDCFFAMSPQTYRAYGNRNAPIEITANTANHQPAFFATEAGASVCSPGASARGPARQLGRFYEMLLNRGQNFVTPQTAEALTARHRAGIMDLTFKHIIDWGLGFLLNSPQYKQPTPPYSFGPHASLRTFGHAGNQSSVGFTDPEHALVAILIFNGMPGEPLHQKRMLAVLTALYKDLGITSTP